MGAWRVVFWVGVMAALNSGCIAALFSRSAGFDQRPLTVQTISFFNQRQPSRLAKRSWKGDWIFRRDRLELIDRELRNAKPDLLFVQEMMAKIGSASESDRNILGAGSLMDYEWRTSEVATYQDTQEVEALATAIGASGKFLDEGKREAWAVGTEGYLQESVFEYEDQPVVVFNVEMPRDNAAVWYTFVQERILESLRREKLCPRRLVIAGYLPGDETTGRLGNLLRLLHLKDAATGFCQIAGRCYTATPTNDIFMATVGDESPARTDRVFVHDSSYIYTSVRDFEEVDPANRYVREFGLTRLWPTQRFGWSTQVRLPRCNEDELSG